jgi:hypothetical protein
MSTFIISLFIVGALGLVALTWLSRRENSSIPTFGDLSGFVMAYEVGRVPVGRIAVLGFWWWVGWHFFAR